MSPALFLSACLAGQLLHVPSAEDGPPPQPAAVAPAVRAQAGPTAKAAAPAFKRNPTIDSTIRRKQDAAARKKIDRIKAAERKRREAEAWRLYVERVGPVIAAQEREQWQRNVQAAELQQRQQQLQIEADKAASLRRLSDAAAWNAYQNSLRPPGASPR